MGLEELAFDVEGIKLYVKPELHRYHAHADDDPFLGLVPVRVEYLIKTEPVLMESATSDDFLIKPEDVMHQKKGFLRYDSGKKIFITALSDFVPTDHNNVELFEKYAKGVSEAARVYTVLLLASPHLTNGVPVITQKHYFRDSQGEWKDIGDWLGVYTDKELRAMADAVK